jgi:hypothetical protein
MAGWGYFKLVVEGCSIVVVEEDEVKSTILLGVNVTINRVGGDKGELEYS